MKPSSKRGGVGVSDNDGGGVSGGGGVSDGGGVSGGDYSALTWSSTAAR